MSQFGLSCLVVDIVFDYPSKLYFGESGRKTRRRFEAFERFDLNVQPISLILGFTSN